MDKSNSDPNPTLDAEVPQVPIPFGPRRRQPLTRQEALVTMGRRAIAPPDLPILMQDTATLLADVFGTDYSSVAELSEDGDSLRITFDEIHAKEPRTLIHEASVLGNDSLTGYALQVARPVVVTDLPSEARFHDAFLRRQGIKSAIAVPLKLQDRSFGSMAVCSTEAREFDREDLLFAETIAHLAATTIARKQAEKSLCDERRLAAGVLQTVDALIVVLDPHWQIVSINAACERIAGFSAEEIKGRFIWNVFPVPEEVGLFLRLKEELRENTSPVGYESHLLTKHSQRRLIAWSYSAIDGDDGTLESIIATGVDITEQQQAEEQAELAGDAAEKAREVIAELTGSTGGGNIGVLRQGEAAGTTEVIDKKDGGPAVTINTERRGQPRRLYPYTQKVAAMIDGQLPLKEDFIAVRCYDIAAGGISFISSMPPPSDMLVIALGASPSISYLVAQVANVTRMEMDGQRVFRIGCNYVARAEY